MSNSSSRLESATLTDGAQTRDRLLILNKVIDLAKLCTNYINDHEKNEAATGHDSALVVSKIVAETFEVFPTNFNSPVDPLSILDKLSTKVNLMQSQFGASVPLDNVSDVAEKFSFKKEDLKTSKWARKAHRNEPSAAFDSIPDVPLRIQGTVDKRKRKADDIGLIEVNGVDQDPVPEQLSTAAPTYRIIVPSNRVSNIPDSDEATPVAASSSSDPKKRLHDEELSGKENEAEAPVKKRSKKRKGPLIFREGSRKSSRKKKTPE
ncbi:hypothetical protein JR316_0012290 [Psilocybe cubensis]|uniref:Uncharacterized protein n=2 Tax=Psilocybe cubensis TaxID=181762 RepID=A0A8H7XQU4_PSICU|nr:hypothetical protein JR316_0012290 [Psilocybe cubensis]KAH9475179.1 hypothetical protein JR316_0012290 [Psilocybe cubensis]